VEGDAGPAGLEWSQAHRAFHAALSEGCDSIWLLRTISSLRDHSERYRMLSLRTGTRNTLEEHGAIMQAAVDRDKAAAAIAARAHLRATVEVLEHELTFDGDEQSVSVPPVGVARAQ
jgi:DNA-binding GntR family transcriptional regulator